MKSRIFSFYALFFCVFFCLFVPANVHGQSDTIKGYIVSVNRSYLSYHPGPERRSYYFISDSTKFTNPEILDPIEDYEYLIAYILNDNAKNLSVIRYAFFDIASCCNQKPINYYRKDTSIDRSVLESKYSLPELQEYEDTNTKRALYFLENEKVDIVIIKAVVVICSCPYNGLLGNINNRSMTSNVLLNVLQTSNIDSLDQKLLNRFLGFELSLSSTNK